MNTSASHTSIRRAAAAAALVVGLALTGCQTAAQNPAAPKPAAVKQVPKAPAGIDTHRPADRVADAIERNEDRMEELSKRFAGRPADRIEEELAREAAAGQVQR